MQQIRRQKENPAGRVIISLIVTTFVVVMSLQIVNLYQKNQEYAARQEVLQRELAEADEEQQRLQEYEEYTKSPQYIEDIAKSKLGLVHENEIVFKEEKGN